MKEKKTLYISRDFETVGMEPADELEAAMHELYDSCLASALEVGEYAYIAGDEYVEATCEFTGNFGVCVPLVIMEK